MHRPRLVGNVASGGHLGGPPDLRRGKALEAACAENKRSRPLLPQDPHSEHIAVAVGCSLGQKGVRLAEVKPRAADSADLGWRILPKDVDGSDQLCGWLALSNGLRVADRYSISGVASARA